MTKKQEQPRVQVQVMKVGHCHGCGNPCTYLLIERCDTCLHALTGAMSRMNLKANKPTPMHVFDRNGFVREGQLQ